MFQWLRSNPARHEGGHRRLSVAGMLRARPALRRLIQGRFDAAQSTPDNRRHWANADGLSADAAASPQVRWMLRNRARYEVGNNSYARGIVLTLQPGSGLDRGLRGGVCY